MLRKFQYNKNLPGSTILIFAITSLSILAVNFPSSGIIVLGLGTTLLIETTKLRYKQNKIEISLIAVSTLALFWGWAGPNLGLVARPLATLLFLSWAIYCYAGRPENSPLRISLSSCLVLTTSVLITIASYNQIVTPLLWGYDNSAHVPALSQVYRHHGFLYSGDLPARFSFSNYINGYPPLTTSTWAFLMSVANIRLKGGYEITKFYSFFYFGSGFLLVFLIAKNWTLKFSTSAKKIGSGLLVALVVFLISFSQISFVFWAGFPPFIWACCLILAFLILIGKQSNPLHRVALSALGLTLVNYSYPLLSPTLLTALLFEIAKLNKFDWSNIWGRKRSIVPLIGLAAGLNLAVVLKSLNVVSYIDDVGGIQPIVYLNLLAISCVILLGLVIFKLSVRELPIQIVGFVGSGASFVILAVFSKQSQGLISYYPQKVGYLTLMLGFASLGSILGASRRLLINQWQTIQRFSFLFLSLTAIWFSWQNATNPKYAKFGFTSSSSVLNRVQNPMDDPYTSCFQDAMKLTEDLNSNADPTTIVLLRDDLRTRWINGVRGRLTDETYSISIPMGSSSLSDQSIIIDWLQMYPNSRILIMSSKMPAGVTNYADRISYREFNCE